MNIYTESEGNTRQSTSQAAFVSNLRFLILQAESTSSAEGKETVKIDGFCFSCDFRKVLFCLVRNPSRYEAFWIYGVGVCIFFSFLFHQLSFVLSSDFYVM
ncbi:hypothetical protein NC653_012828 [Populus alba x Populus x berolinensis]|uniref:Uncharacterized protein n=1 Tax=Populus alba x Populus x berolinensis TaxID=444605 RepID=A0AAD6W1T8_9ROSI|nr:hypothetical protein NC653_012828 [Populus alba x Populus x berolinensis]